MFYDADAPNVILDTEWQSSPSLPPSFFFYSYFLNTD